MKRLMSGLWFPLLTDLLLVVVCVLHYPVLRDRAAAPFLASSNGDILYVSELLRPDAAPGLLPGDRLRAWNGGPIPIPTAVEFLGDRGRIGDVVQLDLEREGTLLHLPVTLVPCHTSAYILMVYATGAITLLIGIFILLARPGSRVAAIMHWGLAAVACVIVLAFENVTPAHSTGYAASILFFLSYAAVAPAFFLFSTEFPRPSRVPPAARAIGVSAPLAVVVTVTVALHWRATAAGSAAMYVPYRFWFDLLRIVVIATAVVSTANLVRSFVAATSDSERKKVQWILWGLLIGPLPFLLLTALPMALTGASLLPEDVTLVFFLNIPVTFAVAFMKYHALDVDVVVSRSAAYFILLVLLGGLYAGIVVWLASAISQTWASVAGALAVALLFEPLRAAVQRFVDRRFFRARYDERAAREALTDAISHAVDINALAESVVARIQDLIPVERIAFALVETPRDRLHFHAHRNFGLLAGRSLPFERAKLRTRLERPQALARHVEPGVAFDEGDEGMFARWNLALVLPLASEGSSAEGFLALGPRKSGSRFTLEDVDLLSDTARKAGLAVDRIRTHERLVLEQVEGKRLRELNRMKSDFVGYVSHDLKTPLANIKMYAELLQDEPGPRKRKEFLETIEGESDRLTRMVDTILDSTMIEGGMLPVDPKPMDLAEAADRAVRATRYQIASHGMTAHWKKPAHPVQITADADKVCQAITNLIGNAVKYAHEGKELTVAVKRSAGRVQVSVADRGPGIPEEVMPHLFERFYRDPARSRSVRGTGLGLPLVREIMLRHGGTVEVESRPGKGSTFTLVFPDGNGDGGKTPDPGR